MSCVFKQSFSMLSIFTVLTNISKTPVSASWSNVGDDGNGEQNKSGKHPGFLYVDTAANHESLAFHNLPITTQHGSPNSQYPGDNSKATTHTDTNPQTHFLSQTSEPPGHGVSYQQQTYFSPVHTLTQQAGPATVPQSASAQNEGSTARHLNISPCAHQESTFVGTASASAQQVGPWPRDINIFTQHGSLVKQPASVQSLGSTSERVDSNQQTQSLGSTLPILSSDDVSSFLDRKSSSHDSEPSLSMDTNPQTYFPLQAQHQGVFGEHAGSSTGTPSTGIRGAESFPSQFNMFRRHVSSSTYPMGASLQSTGIFSPHLGAFPHNTYSVAQHPGVPTYAGANAGSLVQYPEALTQQSSYPLPMSQNMGSSQQHLNQYQPHAAISNTGLGNYCGVQGSALGICPSTVRMGQTQELATAATDDFLPKFWHFMFDVVKSNSLPTIVRAWKSHFQFCVENMELLTIVVTAALGKSIHYNTARKLLDQLVDQNILRRIPNQHITTKYEFITMNSDVERYMDSVVQITSIGQDISDLVFELTVPTCETHNGKSQNDILLLLKLIMFLGQKSEFQHIINSFDNEKFKYILADVARLSVAWSCLLNCKRGFTYQRAALQEARNDGLLVSGWHVKFNIKDSRIITLTNKNADFGPKFLLQLQLLRVPPPDSAIQQVKLLRVPTRGSVDATHEHTDVNHSQ